MLPSSSTTDYNSLLQSNVSLQSQVDELNKTNSSLYVHISILERALHMSTKELGLIKIDNNNPAQALVNYSSLQTQIELAKKTLDILNNDILHNKNNTDNIKFNNDIEKIKNLEYELKIIKSQNNDYETKIKKLQTQYNKSNLDIPMQPDIIQLKSELDNTKMELLSSINRQNVYKANYDQLEKSYNTLQSELSALKINSIEIEDDLMPKLNAISAENENLTMENIKCSKELLASTASNNLLNENLTLLQNEIFEKIDIITKLNNDIKNLKLENVNLVLQIDELLASNKLVEPEINKDLTNEISSLQLNIQTISKHLQSKSLELSQSNLKLRNFQSEFDVYKEECEFEKDNLFSKVESELTNWSQKLENKNNVITELQEKFHILLSKKEKYHEEVLQNINIQRDTNSDTSASRLKKELEIANEKYQSLLSEHKKLEEINTNYSNEIDELEHEFEQLKNKNDNELLNYKLELENIESFWHDRLNQEIEDKNYLQQVMAEEVETLKSQIGVLEDALIVDNNYLSKNLANEIKETNKRSGLDEPNHLASTTEIESDIKNSINTIINSDANVVNKMNIF